MRNTFINTALGFFSERKDLFMISGDAGLGVFDDFKAAYPDRFLNMGVAEQNMLSFAAGLAMSGYRVFAYNIIPFVLYRCYEQVRNDICYQKLPVILVGIGSGITYAPQGMTHYSTEDLGIARTLPGLKVISPIDPVEAAEAARYAIGCDSPVYIRLAKRGEPPIHKNGPVDISKPSILRDGSDAAIVFHGSIAPEAISAAEILAAEGISVRLISMPLVQPFDKHALFEKIAGTGLVVVVEEHFANCGLGCSVKEAFVDEKPSWKLATLGLPFEYIHSVMNTETMRAHLGISAGDIAETVIKNLH